MGGLLFAGLTFVVSGPATAQSVELVRWVDSSMPVPGGQGNFFLDAVEPSFCELGLVFEGREADSFDSGIYRAAAPGQVEVLVDERTPVPGGQGNFTEVEDPLCSGRRVVFKGFDGAVARQGLYIWEAGQVTPVVTHNTPAPHGTSNLTGFAHAGFEGSTVAFKAQDQAAAEAVFLHDGALRLLAAVGDPVPWRPGASFDTFAPPRLSGGVAVFGASFGFPNDGLVKWGGELSLVAERGTPVPDQPGAVFSSLSQPAISHGRVVFAGGTPLGDGVYQHENGALSTLLPPGIVLDKGSSPLYLTRVQVDGPSLAFLSYPVLGRETLYLSRGHGLVEVVSWDSFLDGRQVLGFRYALVAGHLTLQVWFRDASSALYVADLLGATEVPDLEWVGRLLLIALIAAAALLTMIARR